MEKTKLTREELYHLVWSQSMRSLSKKYQISDNGLRKICKKMNIPLPKNGNWSKVQHGYKVSRTPLPNKNEGPGEIELSDRNTIEEYESVYHQRKILKQEIEKELNISWEVPKRLSSPNSMVVDAKISLESKEHGRYRYEGLYCTEWHELNIRVAPENFSRSLRFVDFLIKTLKLRGHEIKLQNYSTLVVVYGEEIEVSLKERMKRVVTEERYGTSSRYSPTGILSFRVDKMYGPEKEWVDGRLKIEDRVLDIIVWLELEAKRRIEEAQKRKEIRLIREEKDRIEREIIEKEEAERRKFEKLIEDANRWKQAEVVREYLGVLEKNIDQNVEINQELATFIKWGRMKIEVWSPLITN